LPLIAVPDLDFNIAQSAAAEGSMPSASWKNLPNERNAYRDRPGHFVISALSLSAAPPAAVR
jgi:hypothetical protein